ncbi:MAG: hypothetical protein AAB433_16860, partial [Nitrospirota bacterium]
KRGRKSLNQVSTELGEGQAGFSWAFGGELFLLVYLVYRIFLGYLVRLTRRSETKGSGILSDCLA